MKAVRVGPLARPLDARELQRTGQLATTGAVVGWSAVGVAVALGAAAGIIVPFTNWDAPDEGEGARP